MLLQKYKDMAAGNPRGKVALEVVKKRWSEWNSMIVAPGAGIMFSTGEAKGRGFGKESMDALIAEQAKAEAQAEEQARPSEGAGAGVGGDGLAMAVFLEALWRFGVMEEGARNDESYATLRLDSWLEKIFFEEALKVYRDSGR